MSNRVIIFSLLFTTLLFGIEIPTEKTIIRSFGDKVALNAQVIQLSDAKQNIMSIVDGHIERYYVKPAQTVKKGDKIALIESITLSKMTAQYISLREQFSAMKSNYSASKTLFDKGLTSQQELNTISIEFDSIKSKLSTLASQLKTLGISPNALKKASSDYILYAHSSGIVSEILQPLHSVVSSQTQLITITSQNSAYLKMYLPLEYAHKVNVGMRVVAEFFGEKMITEVTHIMPEIDLVTQRVIVLAPIEKKKKTLFINAFLKATLYFDPMQTYVAIKKSALSFFNNEWVVFLPNEEAHDEDDKNDEHEEEVPFESRVVEIITEDGEYIAIKGVDEGEVYVSDKSYYVKSMLLKSSLGEDGH